jgi:CMP/dCMP kinase
MKRVAHETRAGEHVRVVAIDGPAGAGKSTIARLLASTVGIPYLDTGAMYRAITVAAIDRGVPFTDEQALGDLARAVDIYVGKDCVLLDGVDVTERIRTHEINSVVSHVATNSGVRAHLRRSQREWVSRMGGGIVEGRDIATVVFPDACLKIFLTASARERARRRVEQSGGNIDEVERSIRERDERDSTRVDGPLAASSDAFIVDTTGLSVDQVIAELTVLVGERCV